MVSNLVRIGPAEGLFSYDGFREFMDGRSEATPSYASNIPALEGRVAIYTWKNGVDVVYSDNWSIKKLFFDKELVESEVNLYFPGNDSKGRIREVQDLIREAYEIEQHSKDN